MLLIAEISIDDHGRAGGLGNLEVNEVFGRLTGLKGVAARAGGSFFDAEVTSTSSTADVCRTNGTSFSEVLRWRSHGHFTGSLILTLSV
jgi:hypothetical protein